jgi:hypothetical protein
MWELDIKMNFNRIQFGGVDYTCVAQGGVRVASIVVFGFDLMESIHDVIQADFVP